MYLDVHGVAAALGGEIVGNQILAPGPGHSREDRSLAVRLSTTAPDGFVVHSFAGDDPIVCRDFVRHKVGLPAWTAGKQASSPSPMQPNTGQPRSNRSTEYIYRDEGGQPYLRVERYEPKGAFPQSYWTGSAWASGKPSGPKIPYRLPDILAAVHDTVFVCEGEKDADRLASAGFVATTASEGAGKWTPDLNKWFAGKTVHVLADNDPAGQRHAREVAESLSGVASEVRVINLPGLPPKGDVSDWLDGGGDPAALVALCEAEALFGSDRRGQVGLVRSAASLRTKVFSPVHYVVPGYIAEGCTLLAGRPKIGKSWLMLDIGLAVASGGPCLGGVQSDQGDVLYLALEDNERRLQTRIGKILGDTTQWPERFTYSTEWNRAQDGGLDDIRNWITSAEKPRLVVVDVLASIRSRQGGKSDLYATDYADVKDLQEIASGSGVAIVLVHHLRKVGSEGDPIDKVSGTLGLSAGADTILVLDHDGHGVSLYGRGRDIEEIETAVEFDRAACRWRILGAARDIRRSTERQDILSTLANAADPMSPSALADAMGVRRNNVDQLLGKMVRRGEVEKVGRGAYRSSSKDPPHQ